MTHPSKILIAYDGSAHSNSMLLALESAGLPAHAEALVVCVAESWLPPSLADPAAVATSPQGLDGARALAGFAAVQLRTSFPGWDVSAEVLMGSPARILVRKAKEWGAEMVVAGALGHSAWERLLIGSVSHKVASEVHCSVRIVRPTGIASNLLLIAHDGNDGAELAVRATASRNWRPGTHARLVMAIGYGPPPAGDLEAPAHAARVMELLRPARELLQKAGLDVSTVVREGDPKHLLVEEATKAGANVIILGVNDHSMLDRVLLGTVADALLARAPCSVEIVR